MDLASQSQSKARHNFFDQQEVCGEAFVRKQAKPSQFITLTFFLWIYAFNHLFQLLISEVWSSLELNK